jgi:hypothetical protein
MRVFYYQWVDGRTWLVCVSGGNPTRKSPIWKNQNTCAWIVPGTIEEEEEDADV